VPTHAVVSAVDARNIYEIPLVLHMEGLDDEVCRLLRLEGEPDLSEWEQLVERVDSAETPVRIGLIGKYVNLPDAYLSVVESLRHAGFAHGGRVEVEWIQAEEVTGLLGASRLQHLDGMVIPGGFGERGLEGKIAAAGFARENDIPCLGLCLGLQMMVVEFSRSVAGLEGASTRELDPRSPHLVVDLMDEQKDVVEKGGTMRLGSYVAKLEAGSQIEKAYGEPVVYERHRHRLEVNPRYHRRLQDAGLRLSGTSPDGRLVEFIELPSHPCWIGTQAHPEFKSRPNRPHPLFLELVGAAMARAEGRSPRLIDVDDLVPAVPSSTRP
jgi:CTP synthase